jgi:hypothetical protein
MTVSFYKAEITSVSAIATKICQFLHVIMCINAISMPSLGGKLSEGLKRGMKCELQKVFLQL